MQFIKGYFIRALESLFWKRYVKTGMGHFLYQNVIGRNGLGGYCSPMFLTILWTMKVVVGKWPTHFMKLQSVAIFFFHIGHPE